jgi:DMSO reductase anchor subunit
MTKRVFHEWPLAAFTLAIQLACGIAIATTISAATHAASTTIRALGISVFPIVATGLLLSHFHLGRPISAWRALSNPLQSRLSLEILLTAAFALSGFFFSFASFIDPTAPHLFLSATTSFLGLATVIASASIYQLPTRPIWNSAYVTTSFLGSTILVSALALRLSSTSTHLAIPAILVGAVLLFASGTRMFLRAATLDRPASFRPWFVTHLLLVASAPLTMFSLPATPAIAPSLAICTAALAIITGRLLMFALAEFEPRF